MNIKTKAAIFWRLAFSVTFISICIACEDPGSIGGGFIEKSEITVDTIQVTNLTESNQDAYLGRLSRTAMGRFEDGLVGDIQAVSLFKPSIQRASEDLVLNDSTNLSLRLQFFENLVYGDTTSIGTYSIYRVNSEWRGSSLRSSTDIVINEGELIGQFSDSNVDTNGTISVNLSGSWKDDYINYFNLPGDTRDDAYRLGDHGLAIVPDEANNKIMYASFTQSNLTAFASDTTSRIILDWGVNIERTGELSNSEKAILHSTFDRIFRFSLTEIIDGLENKNFVKAELVFKEDTLALSGSLNPNEVRTSALGMGLKLGPSDDIAYRIGFSVPDFSAFSSDGFYRFSLTKLVNDYLYGEATVSDVYLYLSSSSGTLSYTSFFTGEGSPQDSPKLIIYGLDAER